MYQFGSLLSGVIIAVMVAINGNLAGHYGEYAATTIIHLAGLVFLFLIIKARRQRALPRAKLPAWLYLGGVIGVFSTLFNNFAFGKISMTGIVALSLFGETATALLIDSTGLFGMEKRRLRVSSVAGLAFSAAGIVFMLSGVRGAAAVAVAVSIGAGMTVVLSRTVNARLAEHTGEVRSSFINHLVGLGAAAFMLLLLGRPELTALAAGLPRAPWWVYLGGVMGAIVVCMCNVIVPRIPAFQVTLLTFVGQVFTGVAIDMFARRDWSRATFVGGLFVAVGIAIDLAWTGIAAWRQKKTGGE